MRVMVNVAATVPEAGSTTDTSLTAKDVSSLTMVPVVPYGREVVPPGDAQLDEERLVRLPDRVALDRDRDLLGRLPAAKLTGSAPRRRSRAGALAVPLAVDHWAEASGRVAAPGDGELGLGGTGIASVTETLPTAQVLSIRALPRKGTLPSPPAALVAIEQCGGVSATAVRVVARLERCSPSPGARVVPQSWVTPKTPAFGAGDRDAGDAERGPGAGVGHLHHGRRRPPGSQLGEPDGEGVDAHEGDPCLSATSPRRDSEAARKWLFDMSVPAAASDQYRASSCSRASMRWPAMAVMSVRTLWAGSWSSGMHAEGPGSTGTGCRREGSRPARVRPPRCRAGDRGRAAAR